MCAKVLAFAAGIAFLTGCGWFVREAGPERKFDQGLSYLRANQPEQTHYCLVSIDHRADYQPEASLLRGWLRLQSQSHQALKPEDYTATWADLSDALEVRKCRPLTLALMGRLLYEGGRFANALNVLNGALAEDPDEIEAHRWLGSALYDVGAMVPALDHLKRVADQEVANGRICRLLALIYRDRGAYREAAAAYQESLARNPAQPDAEQVRIELARCQIAFEDYDAALTGLQDCADSADVLALRGLCYAKEGNRERAQQYVTRALEENPQNAAALKCLALLDPSSAVEPLLQAVEKEPHNYEIQQWLVEAFRALGQEELAEEHEQRLLALRKLRAELDSLQLQADENVFDASLRYRIADAAQRLGLPELADNWQKAARMLGSSDAELPLPSLVTPPGGY